ncbi:MAG: hypothetical protein PHQ62_01905 [Clostridia bacterium]|nr:hypothetical protein [Clostridia bacterium]
MKKKLVPLLFCFLIVFSALSFSGCNEIILDHNILVTSSNTQKGTVNGTGFYKTNQNVVLSATPKSEQTFIAWVKNDVVVSYETNYSFLANTATAGKYTALFSTNNLEYFMLKGLSYDISGLEITNPNLYVSKIINFSVKTSQAPSLYTNLGVLTNAEVNNTGNFSDNNFDYFEKIFYLSKTYYFSVTLKAEYTNITTLATTTAEITTNFSINFSGLLNGTVSGSTTTFATPNYTITQTLSNEAYSIDVEYTKLSKLANWNEDATQSLLMTFSYPFVE